MYNVKSRLVYMSGVYNDKQQRENGVLGPFEKRETAERALIALCQAGQATSGEILNDETPAEIENTIRSRVGAALAEAAAEGKKLQDAV